MMGRTSGSLDRPETTHGLTAKTSRSRRDSCAATTRPSAKAPDPVQADFSLRYPGGKWLQVMNWRLIQSYETENPSWHKVCGDLVSHPNYRQVNAEAKLLVHEMFMLAARKTVDGLLPGDPETLQEWLGMDHPPDLEPLLVVHGDAENPFLRYLTTEQYRAERNRIAALIGSRAKKGSSRSP